MAAGFGHDLQAHHQWYLQIAGGKTDSLTAPLKAQPLKTVPKELVAYHATGKPLVCELDVQPWVCEFWPLEELSKNNLAYEVSVYAPGYFGFATSGGGELFAVSPSGAVVCLPFVGMSPTEELHVANTWSSFAGMLRICRMAPGFDSM